MIECITCGDELHPERAEKYNYCTKADCQQQNLRGLTMVSLGVNKSADQYQILDERTRAELADGRHHDPRRASYGPPPRPTAAPAGTPPRREQTAARRPSATTPQPTTRPPRRPWTPSQQRLALLYNGQGLRPEQIADKLGLSRYTVCQIILTAPRERRPQGR